MRMDWLVLDHLDMLVTSDPVAELDGVLVRTTDRLRAARATGDAHTAERLAAWLDVLLDQRLEFDYGIPS